MSLRKVNYLVSQLWTVLLLALLLCLQPLSVDLYLCGHNPSKYWRGSFPL